jgi:hypothetical protein
MPGDVVDVHVAHANVWIVNGTATLFIFTVVATDVVVIVHTPLKAVGVTPPRVAVVYAS